jgi:hypothetical protein
MLLQARSQMLARGTTPRVSSPVAVVAGSLLLGVLSLLLPSTPTYDPFSWIIWGREILHLDLNTVDGPSWKPLPVVITTLSAPFGEASPYIWVAVARAGAIAGVALAWLLAARMAGHAAGFIAAVTLAVMPWWIRNGALGNSEGLMVAFVLAVVLCHLHGRRGWAFTLAIGAAWLRPEAWPFLGLYALFLLWEDRGRLRWLALGFASLPVVWLLPEWWGSGNPFRASDRAQTPNADSPAFADNPALEVTKDAIALAPALAVAFGGVALGVAALTIVRRGGTPTALAGRLPTGPEAWTALLLALLAALWVALVAVMTVRGFSGNARYLMVPGALIVVVGAAGAVWAVRALVPTLPPALAAAAALVLSAGFVAPDLSMVSPTLKGVAYQADLYDDLGTLIEEAGGAERLKACGHAFTGPFLVPQVAWRLGVHAEQVDLRPAAPAVVFHVRTVAGARLVPPERVRRPNVLARAGHWAITADCEAGR